MFCLETAQRIPTSREEVWEFISSPHNLKLITPDYMGFDIVSPNLPGKMYAGMVITYKVSPVLGIKTRWISEITHVREGEYFVDEQRVGPYKMWHHEHHLEDIEGGVLMRDIISYIPPFGPLGVIAQRAFIGRKLQEIFGYREMKLTERFGSYTEPSKNALQVLSGSAR